MPTPQKVGTHHRLSQVIGLQYWRTCFTSRFQQDIVCPWAAKLAFWFSFCQCFALSIYLCHCLVGVWRQLVQSWKGCRSIGRWRQVLHLWQLKLWIFLIIIPMLTTTPIVSASPLPPTPFSNLLAATAHPIFSFFQTLRAIFEFQSVHLFWAFLRVLGPI